MLPMNHALGSIFFPLTVATFKIWFSGVEIDSTIQKSVYQHRYQHAKDVCLFI